MSNLIHNYSINAQLSMAAYADLDNIINNDDLITRFEQAGMSNSQARTFAGIDENGAVIPNSGFEIIDHYIPPAGENSGFSATVFRNRETGEYHFSVRGTEPTSIADLLTDANAVLTGGADGQIIAMLNYYMRLITPVGQNATQVNLFIDTDGNEILTTFTAEGFERLDPAAPINVSGHSLGGHLADAFIKAFPTIGGIATEAFTYNGLGVGGGLDNLLNNVAGLYGITPDTTSDNNDFNVTNLIAEPGIDLVPNAFAASNQLGNNEFLFIENQTFDIQNHFKEHIADALAVYDLLGSIQESISIQTITDILYAASNNADESLESVVTALGKLLNPSFDTGSQLADVDVSTGDRDKLYENIYAIQDNLSQIPGHENFSITSLKNSIPTQLKVRALGLGLADPEEGIAYRSDTDPFDFLSDPLIPMILQPSLVPGQWLEVCN